MIDSLIEDRFVAIINDTTFDKKNVKINKM